MIKVHGWILGLIGGGIGVALRLAGYDGLVNTIATVGLLVFAAWMIAQQQREEWWTR